MPRSPSLLSVALFTAIYLLGAFAAVFVQQNVEFLFYILVVIILGAGILAIHRRVHFSTGLLWCLSIWGLVHMLGGLVHPPASWPMEGEHLVLYSLWIIPDYLKFDNLVHAYGFAVATWACWQALRAAIPKIQPTVGILTLCMLGGMGLGAVNEIVEFIAVLLIPGTNVGGYINTGWDLVANFIGSAVAAFGIAIAKKQR